MNAETLAKKLNGISHKDDIDNPLLADAKANGLVIVFGESDDLMEFRGVIDDEIGAFDGGVAFVNSNGLIENKCDDEDCPYFLEEKEKGSKIEAIWDTKTEHGEETTWLIKTDIPHESFKMVDEDGNLFCMGIVFSLADVESKIDQHELKELRAKANSWDKLGKEIERFYYDENGNERPDDDEYGDGLCGIGEAAAIAYGWL